MSVIIMRVIARHVCTSSFRGPIRSSKLLYFTINYHIFMDVTVWVLGVYSIRIFQMALS